jgi:RNA polymerase sigma-70 factor (ECF subfamily)
LRDMALVRRILGGDKAAGEGFVAEHYARIYRLLRHLAGDVENVEDLTQQTLVKAWQALGTFRGESSLATWLHRIAYHEYTHWLRAHREHASLTEAADVPDPHAAHALEAVLVRRALAQLSPEHRATFILYHVQGLSVSEVAIVLDLPRGTVKSRLFIARQRLRELLEDAADASFRERPRAEVTAAVTKSKGRALHEMPMAPSRYETL